VSAPGGYWLKNMHVILVSACLLGEAVRYNGGDNRCDHALLKRWLDEGRVVPVCPEVAGGLPTPRPPAEITRGGGGRAVLGGEARVLAINGRDVTEAFIGGAEHALLKVREMGIRIAVLKEGSPSCGSGAIYDGSFSATKVPGVGVTTARLQEAGVCVFSEHQLEDAARMLVQLERTPCAGLASEA
jgi:uncharacterized protein YbbK (DUF523 family)